MNKNSIYNSLKTSEEDVFVFPASYAQQRLWFIDQLEPNSANYNISTAYHLKGRLNITALQQAVAAIIQRHEILRTTFAIEKGSPVQIIAADGRINLSIIDLRSLSEPEQSSQVKALINQEAQQPFNLANGSLLRITLLQLNQESHILILTIHHIISDAWSMGVLIKELSTLYTGFSKGETPSLEPLSIQYADFTLWQRDWLTGEVLDTQLNYWKQQLADIPPLLELPTDYPRPSVPSYRGNAEHFQLSAQLTKKLKALSQDSETTLFMTLLAAFATLLYRYSGQADVVIGSPIANRNRQEIEPLIGFFVNTLVLRTRCEGNPSFQELLTQVKQVCLDAYAHQDLPFEKLVEELQPQRHLSHNPLFQVMFILQNASEQQWELPGINVTPVGMERKTAKFDLSLSIKETAEGITGSWSYSQDLFEAATISRMMEHFQVLLEAIVATPTQQISKLPLLTESEKNKLLVEWNNTQIDYPKDLCIHQLFEQQVEQNSNAVAVLFEDQQLTYRELNQKANQLAHYLQQLGVKPEVLVGICVERSIEMIVGILGILKAGGAYVPLDPTYPTERLSFMLEDANISVLLTQKKLQTQLPQHQAQVICLDTDWKGIDQECSTNFASLVQSDNLAYIIYTSGSTGTPKGVEMAHLPLVNLTLWQLQNSTVSSPATTLQFTPISFDVSFQEIFSTFCSGGKLVLISQENRQNPEALLNYLIAKKIQRLFLPFVALQQLAQAVEHLDRIPTYLCEVMTAGEQLQISPSIANLFNHLPHCTLHNHYGPSESHVVTAFTLPHSPSHWSVLPPIGCPIANIKTYILDSHLQPLPIGVTGELYIGGEGLARGYLNRPELTEERFISNPFGAGHLYKTGDQARYLPDGNIEFIGRIDNQVKIRGFRIELGEIETVLSQHPDVEETIVIVQEYQPEDQRLIAYVVPNQKQVPTFLELRQFLKQTLPEYMIPAAFVPLEALPLTPNGKLNRHALPVPNWGEHISETTYIVPRNPIEQKLAEIWAEVLWLEQPVGIHDNFFELGGHSLLSVKLVAEIEKAFQTKLPLKALFQLSTIAEIATVLDNKKEVEPTQTKVKKTSRTPQLNPEIYHQLLAFTAGWKGQRVNPESLIIGLNTKGSQPALFWCFQGFRELSQMAKYIGSQQPIYGMRSGHLIMEYTEENIQALAAHYVQEILSIQPESSYRLGGNCQSGHIMFEIAQQLQQQGKTVAILCLLEVFIPKPYFGEVALFFGRESGRFNPYKAFAEPELGYRKFYRSGFSINIISGDHGQYFNEPHIQIFARKLRETLAQVETDESSILTEEAYRAQLKGVRYLTTQAGETLSLTVTVKNISSVTWLATEKSGIFLANHWLDQHGEIIQWLDGRIALPQDLQPSATVELNLSVTAPIEPGFYHLELDLVEEGITWFKEKESETIRVQVEVTTTASENRMRSPSNLVQLSGEKRPTVQLSRPELLELGPCIMGGTGGSGTRAIARIVQAGGMFIGTHRNVSEDALNIIEYPWLKILLSHWQSPIPLSQYTEAVKYLQLALEKHLAAFDTHQNMQQWGWKIPPSIFTLPFLHEQFPQIKCLHLVRDGRDMAFSKNQNQLGYLGPVVLTSEEQTWSQPLQSMALWNRLNLLTANYGKQQMPSQYLQVRFEDLCTQPVEVTARIFEFFNLEGDIEKIASQIIETPLSLGRWQSQDSEMIATLNLIAQEGLQQFGYLEFEENHQSSNLRIQIKEDIQDCQKGQDRFDKGDFFSAIKFYQKAINLNPNQSFEVYFQLAKALGATGKVYEAIACYQKVIELQPDFADVYWHLGQLQSQQGQLNDAIANYEKALNITPSLAWIYPLLAEAFTQNQQLEDGISVYQKALELIDDDTQIYSRLGNLHSKVGNLEEATTNYQKAIELQPDSVNLYNKLGNILLKKGDLEAAIAACQKSIKLHSQQVPAYTILGNTFNQKGEYHQAIAAYQKAIEFQNENPNPHLYFLLGNTCRQIEDFQLAIDTYEKALTLNPKNTFGIYRNLAETFKQSKQIKEAIETYQKALELQPKNKNIRRIINQLKQQ